MLSCDWCTTFSGVEGIDSNDHCLANNSKSYILWANCRMLKRLHSNIVGLAMKEPEKKKKVMRVGDVHRRTVAVMDIQPSRAQDRDISSDSRDSCWGAAVVLYRDYISMVSVVDGPGGGGRERTERTSQRQWKDGCQGPRTIWGWGGLRPQLQLGRPHFQLRLDFECWMSHCSVISAHEGTDWWRQQAQIWLFS